MPHTDAIYQIKPEPIPRSVLAAEFRRKHKGKVQLYAITDGTAIKFGSAWDIQFRLNTLQTGNCRKLTCLASIIAKKGTEAALHRALFYQRLRGEWFLICQQTARVVDLFGANDPEALYEHIGRIFISWGVERNANGVG